MLVERNKYVLESMDGTGPITQKLVGGVREKYIQHWQQRTKGVTRQVAPSITRRLSIVVTVSNEQENIKPLLESLRQVFADVYVEVIFVGDSDNMRLEGMRLGGIKDVARTMHSMLFQIRMEQSLTIDTHHRGLGDAIVRGLHEAQAEYILVIPANLQFQAGHLHIWYDQAVAQNVDLVIASLTNRGRNHRGVPGHLAGLARQLFPRQLRGISDPWSNLFLVRRELLADVILRPKSHNILLELLVRCRWHKLLELQYDAQIGKQRGALRQKNPPVWQHMLRLWCEVPAAGRIWKMGFLLLVSIFLVAALFMLNGSFPWILSNWGVFVFAVIAGLDFVILNRFIFPSTIVGGATSSFSFAEGEGTGGNSAENL